ncbi:hypothetical protein Tco_0826687 [Tanacetum coccineum]
MVDTFRRPPRGDAEEEQLGFLLSRMDGIILTNIPGHWIWSLEATCEFFVKSVRKLIDDLILPKEEVTTSSYLFFSYPMARQLWRKLMHWWELEDIDLASYDDWLI